MSSKQEKAFEKSLLDFLGHDADRAFAVMTSHFVSLTLEMVKRRVGEPVAADKSVTLEGGKRDITIHAEVQDGR